MQVFLIKKILCFLAYFGVSIGISAFIFISQMIFTSILYSMIMFLYPDVSNVAMHDEILSEESEDAFDVVYSLVEGVVICCVMFGNLTCKSVTIIFKLQILAYFITLFLNLCSALAGSKGRLVAAVNFILNCVNLIIMFFAVNLLLHNQQIPAIIILFGYIMQVGIGFSRMFKAT